MNCQSYALTIRPLDGITDDQIAKVTKWIKKKSTYYHVVTEKTGSARHLHAGLFLPKAIPRSNICQCLKQLLKELTDTEKKVMLQGVKIMYNMDFISNYLNKDDSTVVIESHLPEKGFLESWFPPKPTPQVKAAKCSLYYHELEQLWHKHQSPSEEINSVTCRHFLFKMMYSLRVLPVIRDDKQIVQVSRHLTRWLNKAEYSTIELPCFEKEE